MFVFDDLHWTDDATLALVAHLIEHVDAPTLLVGTYCHEDMPEDHPIEHLHERPRNVDDVTDWGSDTTGTETEADNRVTTMDLGPFDREATRGLVEYHIGSPEVPD